MPPDGIANKNRIIRIKIIYCRGNKRNIPQALILMFAIDSAAFLCPVQVFICIIIYRNQFKGISSRIIHNHICNSFCISSRRIINYKDFACLFVVVVCCLHLLRCILYNFLLFCRDFCCFLLLSHSFRCFLGISCH